VAGIVPEAAGGPVRPGRTATSRRSTTASRSATTGRSPARATLVIVSGVLVALAAIVVIVSSVGGSGGKAATSTASTAGGQARASHPRTHVVRHSTGSSSPAASPAETHVVVLNGTETTNLAHDVSGLLRQSGYVQATPLAGRPAGENQVTVVEYAPGHQAEAKGVARSLGVTHLQPLESSAASLAGTAAVVVVVGADRASSAGGSGESSGAATTAVP
jgi:hypothetical protein